jgi:hypothetical protein
MIVWERGLPNGYRLLNFVSFKLPIVSRVFSMLVASAEGAKPNRGYCMAGDET